MHSMQPFSPEWFAVRFVNYDPATQSDTPAVVPEDIRAGAERICRNFDIKGLCDPMYISNVTAYELGRGNGCGEFSDFLPRREEAQTLRDKVATRLEFAYSSCIFGGCIDEEARASMSRELRKILAETLVFKP